MSKQKPSQGSQFDWRKEYQEMGELKGSTSSQRKTSCVTYRLMEPEVKSWEGEDGEQWDVAQYLEMMLNAMYQDYKETFKLYQK